MIFAASGQHYFWFEDLAIWSLVVFVLLCLLLLRYASGPIIELVTKREDQILGTLRQADIAHEELEELRREQQAKRERSKEQAKAMIVEAKSDAKRTLEEIVARAQSEATRVQERADREIGLAEQKALQEICRSAADFSIAAAEKILVARLTPEDHKRLVERSMNEIGESAVAV